MSQTSQVYAHLNEPAEKPEVSRFSEAVSRGSKYVRHQSSQIRMPEFIMAFLLLFGEPVPGVGLPFNQVVIIVLAAYGLTRKPTFDVSYFSGLRAVMFIAMGYLAIVSMYGVHSEDASDWTRRLLRLVAATVLIWVIAAGRLHIRSIVLGYSSAILFNAVGYFAGFAPSTGYVGYLTGWLGDKNFSGLVYCLFGLMILSFARNRIEVIGAIVVFSGLLWATGSRTSMAAYAAGLIWVLVAHRMKSAGRIALGVVLYWLIDILTSDYAQSGAFADRTGTDALRSLIDHASEIKVQASGFFGQGLGEAYVYLAHTGSKTWFFHNSYWSALVEGGWPWMILVVTITLLFIVNIFSGKKTLPPKFYVVQGAGVAIMICASRLGEVFYTWPWAIACGLALRVLLLEREQRLGTGHDEASIEGFDERIEVRDAEEADNHVLATQNTHKA
ncbi:O-antigen ligase family protein [Rothia mucilaginosa]|uniref:O-antigen ligase family protein n=1 Tax=Rothia mucilaginosa TaxID=43675 RepID=UPI0028DB8056|nr:O-antigen ligase family protein [Rothia mucilaginosa]